MRRNSKYRLSHLNSLKQFASHPDSISVYSPLRNVLSTSPNNPSPLYHTPESNERNWLNFKILGLIESIPLPPQIQQPYTSLHLKYLHSAAEHLHLFFRRVQPYRNPRTRWAC